MRDAAGTRASDDADLDAQFKGARWHRGAAHQARRHVQSLRASDPEDRKAGGKRDLRKLSEHIKLMRELEERQKRGEEVDEEASDPLPRSLSGRARCARPSSDRLPAPSTAGTSAGCPVFSQIS